ncbi:MAG TPA: alkaline phosphatase family protein [Mycobacteriales bacterium]|nr:alkaline phosphatase family protein [Mycobacteriales bacterium]
MLRRLVYVVVALASTMGCVSAASSKLASTESALSGRHAPCGWEDHATYRHVIWIWMENRSYNQVLGRSGGAKNLASYANACGVATNYDAITHPSLANYLAATSGSTHGIKDDCDPSSCPVGGRSLFSQLDQSGAGWGAYAENMRHPCDERSYDKYAARHNPAVYYSALRKSCRASDLAMGGTKGRFARHLAAGHLPGFVFVTPNLCDDGHDCSTATADSWLGSWLNRITASRTYRNGSTVVFVTWDENDYSASSNQVATVVIGPTVTPGTRSHRHFTHYALLRTTEQLLGVGYLRKAATATSLRAAFNL